MKVTYVDSNGRDRSMLFRIMIGVVPFLPRRLARSLAWRMFEKSLWLKQVRFEGGGSLAMRGRVSVHEAVLFASGDKAPLEIGAGVILNDYARMIAGDGAIKIGDGAYIGPYCLLDGSGGLSIGAKTMLGPFVQIFSHNHAFANDRPYQDQPNNFAPVCIGSNVWLGANVLITAGVTIGDGAVVGAGAVVTKSIPARHLARGVPAVSIPLPS